MIARIFNQKYTAVVFSSTLLLGVLIYADTFHSSFHFDDIASIVENSSIRNIWNLRAIWNFCPTRFITYFSLALNYHISQLQVFSYHLLNVAIHVSAAILVWWLMLLTFSTPAMRGQKITAHARLIAFFAGLIFLAHPLQTQGVTYIIQRAASLATLLYLAALSLYVKSRLLPQPGRSRAAPGLLYCGSLVAVVMAMFTKEITITLPLMVLVYEACFLKTEKKLSWKHLVPFFAALLIVPLTMLLTKTVDVMEMRIVDKSAPTDISPWQYLLTQFRVIVTYVRLLFIPLRQNLDYDYQIAKSLREAPVLASLALLASMVTIAIRICSRYRLISFGIFWFFLTLSVESSVIPIRDVIFEHRLYLPMAGFSFFMASVIWYLFENKTLKSMVIALLLITSCYAVLSYRRNLVWRNELTLWDDTVHKSPGKARPYTNRGVVYETQGNFPQAIADYTKALELNPRHAEAYNNRGNVYDKQGNFSQAVADYTKAIETSLYYAEAYNNRGVVYNKQGNSPQAIADCTKAIEINPHYADAYYNRGVAYGKQGNFSQAIADYTKAIGINPNFEQAYNNRGVAYNTQGNSPQAIADYTKALEINPRHAEAYYNRGNVYDKQGNFSQAVADYTKAIGISPDYVDAHNNRGVAYGKQGNFTQAIAGFTRAVEINPNCEQAYNNRGIVYDTQGDLPQAVADFTRAIEISPDYAHAYYNRGIAYARKKEYDKAWADVHKAEELGVTVSARFLEDLKKASGREK